jgi:catechol 2,3-dioxygenase-like lactoylglutathione lyase family enzyme
MMLAPDVETRPWREQLALDDELYREQLAYLFERSAFYREKLAAAGVESAAEAGGLAELASFDRIGLCHIPVGAFRARVEDGWGAKVTEAMGIGDVGVSLWGECEQQDGMHLGARGFVHPELIDPATGAALELDDGATGELVLTHLRHRAAPLLRFRTRDQHPRQAPARRREAGAAASGQRRARTRSCGRRRARGVDPRAPARRTRGSDARRSRAMGQPGPQRVQVEAGRALAGGSRMRKLQSQGVHHITITGADRQTSIDFWEGVLGMPFTFEQPNLDNESESHLYFDPGDGRLITIFTNEERVPDPARTPTDPGCVHHLAFAVSQATFFQAVERLDERGIHHSGVKDRGFMDSIYFTDPLGLLIELASYRFEPPAGFTHAEVLLEAHRLRVERGDYNIAREHLADAIEALVMRSRASLSQDRSPKDPYEAGKTQTPGG